MYVLKIDTYFIEREHGGWKIDKHLEVLEIKT